jgi:UDP-N-acetylmuramoyl-L-alanyl-D-glutamate--2,6-diaminopimelate ligase
VKGIEISKVAEEIGAELTGSGSATVTDVTHDSRRAGTGTLFVAIRGLAVDGHRFVDDVMRRGAVGVISEFDRPDDLAGAWLKVADARVALAKAADIVNGRPSQKLSLIGITGTNGKTTTTYLSFALAEAAGKKAAMLTTVEYRIGERSEPAVRTTPEASDTNRFLREAVDDGCVTAVMEASSQAIDLHRCDFLNFKIAIFTNLTRDHLDYHGTMENYFAAKKKLFDGSLGSIPEASVINIDDEWGKKLADELRSNGQNVTTFGIDTEADLSASDIEVSMVKGTSFTMRTPNGNVDITSPLIGRPHVYNMLAASAAALANGSDLDSIKQGLAKCAGSPGRFEAVKNELGFAVVVDYAHTDDALLNTLKTARELTDGRIITVFGCGGDRDKSKREPMGEIAGNNSDIAIVTSDNPRTEDPVKIIEAVEKGLKRTKANFLSIPDRREAIAAAVEMAKPNDVVIIAGKGHETYQIIGTEKYHFDDREIAAEAISHRAENS